MVFDPFDLIMEVTPDNIMAAVRERRYSTALVMSFRLNEHDLKVRAMESIPIQDGEFQHEDYSSTAVASTVKPALVVT